MSKAFEDVSLSPALAQFQNRRRAPQPSSSTDSTAHTAFPGNLSLSTLSGLPRRSLIRIAVLLAIGIPLALLFFGTGSSASHDGAAYYRPNTAYGQKRAESGLGWNRMPGGSSAGSRFWDFARGRSPEVDAGDEGGRGEGGEAVIDLGESLPLTSFDGGLGGYTVFSNLYLSSGAFLHVSEPSSTLERGVPPRALDADSSAAGSDAAEPAARWARKQAGGSKTSRTSSPPLPHVRQIMSGPRTAENRYEAAGEDRWRVVDEVLAGAELGQRAVYLKGITYIFNDEPGQTGYLVYFKHFVLEAFLGATRALAHVLQHTRANQGEGLAVLPDRVWFPRCGWNPSWRDDQGQNIWFLHHALPDVQIEDANGFHDRAAVGLPVIMERAVIIDRWAAHSVEGDSARWGKMSADVAALSAPRYFWRGIARNVMRVAGVDGPSRSRTGQRGLPVVVYIDGQSGDSKLSDQSHTALIEALKGLTSIAEVHVTKLAAMKRPHQLDLMSRTDIVISAHSDDLSNALWMPASDKSAVIELFEMDGFDRSFELLAKALNHQYIAIQKDKVLTEEEWRAIGSHRGDTATTGFEVDAQLVARTIETILKGPTEDLSNED